MKKTMMIMCGIITGFNAYAEHQPKADVHLRITSGPHFSRANTTYNGVFSVTNTGEIAFTIVTGGKWDNASTRFYQEGDGELQQRADIARIGKERELVERRDVIEWHDYSIENGSPTKTLLPGEGFSFEHKNMVFLLPFGAPGGVYKAEMYLGHDTWIPVRITPTLFPLFTIPDKKGKAGDFYLSPQGTNQYLYVRTGDGKYERISEMKWNTRPKQEDDDTVTFELPDGTQKKLTPTEARRQVAPTNSKKLVVELTSKPNTEYENNVWGKWTRESENKRQMLIMPKSAGRKRRRQSNVTMRFHLLPFINYVLSNEKRKEN